MVAVRWFLSLSDGCGRSQVFVFAKEWLLLQSVGSGRGQVVVVAACM